MSVARRKMPGLRRRRRSRVCVAAGVEHPRVRYVLSRPVRPRAATVHAAAVERVAAASGSGIRRRDVGACAETRKRKLESGRAGRSRDSRMVSVEHHRRRRTSVVEVAAAGAAARSRLHARVTGSR